MKPSDRAEQELNQMKRPNILMIMTDQQRRDTLGAYGCDWIPTPNLDRLASEGTLFTRATVNNPICTPSRASIFTGKPVPGHGVYRVHDTLPAGEVLFTERLRLEAGYHTGLFGKLHVSGRVEEEKKRHPNDGFEVYEWCLEASVGMDSRFNGYVEWLRKKSPEFVAELRQKKRGVLHHPEEFHFTTWAAERTIAFLKAQKGAVRPFFCLMSIFDPHDPYQDHPPSARERIERDRIPKPITRRQAPACVRLEQEGCYLGRVAEFSAEEIQEIRFGYAASLAFADLQIGRVLEALDGSGMAENTLVIFISDHGDQLGDHGLFVKGVGLYEPCVGVPLILRWPGRVPAAKRCDALVQGHDIASTCLSAAGLDARKLCPESEDLVSAIENGHTTREAAIAVYRNSGVNSQGVFWDPPMHSTMARNERYKLILYTCEGQSELELFDLETDPEERHNLAGFAQHCDVELSLLGSIATFLQREVAMLPARENPSIPDPSQMLQNRLK
jgi:arylsulfatase